MTNPHDPAFSVTAESMFAHLEPAQSGNMACGLTKREYFAAMALSVVNWHASLHDSKVTPEIIAKEAVGIADALIAELDE